MPRETRRLVAAVLLAVFGLPASALAASYKIDPTHTTVGFGVRHLFTTVNGTFTVFEGRIVFDPQAPAQTKVEGSIDAASINTNLEKRDEHLRSVDFFDVQKYPKITFVSAKVSPAGEGKHTGQLHGDLTIRGVTKQVALEVEFLGEGKDPWGNTRAGFHAQTQINRKDFGLTWNKTLESGGVLVGEEVKITIDAEAILEPAVEK